MREGRIHPPAATTITAMNASPAAAEPEDAVEDVGGWLPVAEAVGVVGQEEEDEEDGCLVGV
jgi:hypothetical protein